MHTRFLKFTIIGIGIALTLGHGAAAQQQARMELKDGSTLQGDIIGLDQGIYRISTRHLGTIAVDAGDISSLTFGNGQTPATTDSASGLAAQLKDLQTGLMSDAATMDMIMNLANDPTFQAILNDPQIMGAVTRGDISALSQNPAFTRLLDHPGVRAIQQQTGMSGDR